MRDVFIVGSYHETEMVDPSYSHPVIEASSLNKAKLFMAARASDPNFTFPEDPTYEVPAVIKAHIAHADSPGYEKPRTLPVITVELVPEETGQSTFTYRIIAPTQDEYKAARILFKLGARMQLGFAAAE